MLLLREHEAAHWLPFLNLHHDGWTTENGKVAALGTSISLIDQSWKHREIALLLTVGNSSHVAGDGKRMICTRTLNVYGVDIEKMVPFSVSDTASAARKVSKLFVESSQTNCSMHVLNLCLQYAMGLRENKETVEVYYPVTNTRKREQHYCTVGGAFEEGRDLIKNVRALNNYFSTQLRCKRLEEVQALFKLPKLKTVVDCDTRVGFTLKLFQRTIVNYKTFSVYFQKCKKGDDATGFDRLALAAWRLLVEMEAICRPTGDLARFEVQSSELVASELFVLLKSAADRLNSGVFSVCDLESPRTTTTTVKTFPRFDVVATDPTPLTQTCLARLKGQIKQRIANVTAEMVMTLLLDPRTKSSIETLARPPFQHDAASKNIETTEIVAADSIIASGKRLLRDAHREVYCTQSQASRGAIQSETTNTLPNLNLVPSAEDDTTICGAAVPMTNAGFTSLSTLHDQADKILEKWLQYSVAWVSMVLHQAPKPTTTMDSLTAMLMVDAKGSTAGMSRLSVSTSIFCAGFGRLDPL
ncbi:hypothetical protein PInf_002899 [Phytophthora infestans]|nr:hypothetical protein PInf_002899 [Phytophthora infestans]